MALALSTVTSRPHSQFVLAIAPPTLSSHSLPQELGNVSLSDCVKRNPDVNEEKEKSFTDHLMEELKLREAETINRRSS